MDIQRNAFKAALKAGQPQIGLWSSLCSNIVAEIIAHSGYDWILLDMEHSPNEVPGILSQLQALTGGTATPIVRPAWNDPVLIKRLLDIGAPAVLIPFVQNAREAELAVAACRYPPAGIRGITSVGRPSGYGRLPAYLKQADRETCVLVQIETAAALAELEAIARVDGVDGVFIGPADLSASLGHIGNPQHPEVQAAIQDAVRRLQAVGKPAGILAPRETDARRYIEWGYGFIAVGSDLGLLVKGADELAQSFKSNASANTPPNGR
ncbi:HpcH/HpaI aldolase family protein [Microvirga lotononidis]|uniref:2,4-dihydroxyhept-2-ene-1,7-dioic acid aldolase n=1 Tax=Microvirga lotononidis TaxID=864069 RepID=I4YU89_9HYPH|nr:HpcH/HpaI aldolase/citrate lyase family protein [Microvirga lotononidis]EIM27531.1 2,4-dihydroxyhept-2-ene-1,7-dioic acid aldolase [Microvirga lotononidis]WQO28319.1 HpcH/HpaI aldolase/citrate lyase family protein [Microvirga lotononidis]